MSNTNPTIKRSSHVLFQEISGEAMLLNIQTERYYALDEVGTRIWQLIENGKADIDTLIARLLTEFAVNEVTLRADVEAHLSELEAAQLISQA